MAKSAKLQAPNVTLAALNALYDKEQPSWSSKVPKNRGRWMARKKKELLKKFKEQTEKAKRDGDSGKRKGRQRGVPLFWSGKNFIYTHVVPSQRLCKFLHRSGNRSCRLDTKLLLLLRGTRPCASTPSRPVHMGKLKKEVVDDANQLVRL